jgi:hypothetical protein
VHPSEAEAWSAIRALFEEIVELPREARAAALAARTDVGDSARRAVEALLAADARTPVLGAPTHPPPEACEGGAPTA